MNADDARDRLTLSPEQPRREHRGSWWRWAPKGFALAILGSVLIAVFLRHVLDPHASRALAQTVGISALVVDWSRWREAPKWRYAAVVAVILISQVAVVYLIPL